ncbi:type II secretion system GspH family protein [bacterium]|nr:type II secretion system GspH family protein [bacterium]
MPRKRSGFTMIELLVVIGIIAFLATMTLNVLGDAADQAREAATATTVLKVNEMLEKRVGAYGRAMQGARLAKAGDALEKAAKQNMLPDTYGGRALAAVPVEPRLLRQRVAEILAYKFGFQKNFPQNFDESGDFLTANLQPGTNGIPDLLDQIKANPNMATPGQPSLNIIADPADASKWIPTNHTRVTESSEVLYYILTQTDVFGTPRAGSDSFQAGEIADTDGDGLMEFIDSWGQPLQFYRWPTRLINNDATNDAGALPVISATERQLAGKLIKGLRGTNTLIRDPLTIDPEDSLGLVWFELQRLQPPKPNLSLHVNPTTLHDFDVFHTPLIVSAGGDGYLGLLLPTDNSGTATHLCVPSFIYGDWELDDNITNRNRRSGGRN